MLTLIRVSILAANAEVFSVIANLSDSEPFLPRELKVNPYWWGTLIRKRVRHIGKFVHCVSPSSTQEIHRKVCSLSSHMLYSMPPLPVGGREAKVIFNYYKNVLLLG
jgi:hypothetical protein